MIMVLILGVTIVAQVSVEAILGEEATQTSSNQSCWFWVIGCSTTQVSNPQAEAAANLAQQLILPFVVIDIVFILGVSYAVVSAARSGPSGRQLGRGSSRRPR
ncbi:MAG: hypothetical protein L3K07_03865 [Thermoplasmata archaeon]|nr:hypothetical protein [Thermoplasmata archaeon]